MHVARHIDHVSKSRFGSLFLAQISWDGLKFVSFLPQILSLFELSAISGVLSLKEVSQLGISTSDSRWNLRKTLLIEFWAISGSHASSYFWQISFDEFLSNLRVRPAYVSYVLYDIYRNIKLFDINRFVQLANVLKDSYLSIWTFPCKALR